MTAEPAMYGESSWFRILSLTTDMATKIVSALGTKLDFTKAIKVAPTHVGYAATDTKAKWFITNIANGNGIAVPDNSSTINVLDSSVVDTSGSAALFPVFSCSVAYQPSDRTTLLSLFLSGAPVIGIREIGRWSSDGAPAGNEFIVGTIANLKENQQKGPNNMDFDISGCKIGTGGKFTLTGTTPPTFTSFNAAATGSGNTITPLLDGAARTIIALTTTDWDNLLLGNLITKLAA